MKTLVLKIPLEAAKRLSMFSALGTLAIFVPSLSGDASHAVVTAAGVSLASLTAFLLFRYRVHLEKQAAPPVIEDETVLSSTINAAKVGAPGAKFRIAAMGLFFAACVSAVTRGPFDAVTGAFAWSALTSFAYAIELYFTSDDEPAED